MGLVFASREIETWPLERLRPYAKNAKMHGEEQVAKIASSMAKFGWTVPCLVADDGELIAGHGRILAATLLGLKEAPVIRLGHLDEAERRAYRIADNKLLNQAISGTSCALEFGYGLPSGESLTVSVPRVFLPRPRREIQGPQGIQMSFDWQAAQQESGAPMVTITLMNNTEMF